MIGMMNRPRAFPALMGAALAAFLTVSPAAQSLPAPSHHDKAFWQQVAANKYSVPTAESLPALVSELSAYLASPDPELRDDIAYSTLTSWIYRQRVVAPDLRRALINQWTMNLTAGIGEVGTDTVFRRSFSALSLGTLVILDNEAPYLDKAEFDRILNAGLGYLNAERDVRGFDDSKGWIHTVAHTADLLKFAGRSRHLAPAQQKAILDAIGRKLAALETVLINGEDERLARAILSITARADFDQAAFRDWTKSVTPKPGPQTAAAMASGQNKKNVLTALFVVLSTDPRGLKTIDDARAIVLDALKTI